MPLHQSSGRWQLGLALSIVAVLMWGTLPIAETIVLHRLDVATLTWFRFSIAFMLMLLYGWRNPKLLAGLGSAIRTWPRAGLLAIAVLGLTLDYVFYMHGLMRTSPANAEVVTQVAPALLSFGAIVIFKERYTRLQWIGVAILTFGFYLFFHDQLDALIETASQYFTGISFLLLAGTVWAAYALAQKQLLNTLSPTAILLVAYGGCALLCAPFAVPQNLGALNGLELGMLLVCSLNTLFAYATFTEALQHWEASKISAIASLTPFITLITMAIVAAIVPGLVEPERITWIGVLGAVIVIVGSAAIALGERETKGEPPDLETSISVESSKQ